jgi:hypothetical protein
MTNPGQPRGAATRAAQNALVLSQFRDAADAAGIGHPAREWFALHAPFAALGELVRALDPEAFVRVRPMRVRRARRSSFSGKGKP